jgi:hypothetical protein
LESNRFDVILIQSFFPQLIQSELNERLNEKANSLVENLFKKDVNEILNFVNVNNFLKNLSDNSQIFMQNIDNWKKNKIFEFEN